MNRSYHSPIGEPCALCGLERAAHRTRHPVGCGCGCKPRGSSSTRAERVYWIGLDGEGEGRTPHRYTLLSYSDESGKRADSISAPDGLRTAECLDFLLSIPWDARIAGYYLGYDWTMILRDLPNKSIYRLLRPEARYRPADEGSGFSPVHWKGYKLNYVAGCMRVKNRERSVTIWDVGKFFQCPFAKAIRLWGIGTPEDYATIDRMKAARSTFTADQGDEIAAYCELECRLLAQLIAKLDATHNEIGLKLHTWHGPGSTATTALKLMGIREKRGTMPDAMRDPVSRGFFGGRFENALLGEVKGPIHGFDIVSAYPFQAYILPCLEHGAWEYTRLQGRIERARGALCRYRLQGDKDSAWGPLPCRLDNGRILFPRGGSQGWIWRSELMAASNGWRGVDLDGAWVLESDCDCQPFARVLDWFREREAMGKDAKGKTFKLALNSMYGKLSQSVGRPQFRSLIWAGMITSGTRAAILDVLAPSQDDVLAIATDGIYATRELALPDAPISGSRLGTWEAKTHGDTVFLRPGIYWSKNEDPKARGVGVKHMAQHASAAMTAIKRREPIARLGVHDCFGGALQCVREHRGQYQRSNRYGEWFPVPVQVSLGAAPKRRDDWSLWELDGVESAPYRASVQGLEARLAKASDRRKYGNE